MRLLRRSALIVEPSGTIVGVAEDEEDDLVLATAIAGNVDFLVTGDKYLQALDAVLGVSIVSPRQFLEILRIDASRAD